MPAGESPFWIRVWAWIAAFCMAGAVVVAMNGRVWPAVALFLVALLAMVCAFVAGWLIVVRDKERRSGR
jgi:hypothetical protein